MSEKFSKVPEELWALVAPLLPPEPPKPYGGRPRIPDQTILAGVLYRLQTGCQWKALPPQFGSGATCHRRFSQWVASGLFEKIMAAVLKFYDQKLGIAWDWTSMDAAIVKAPKGGDHTGPNLRIPVDLGTRSARDLGGRSGPLGRIGAERRVECVRGGRCGGGVMNRWVTEFSGLRWA